VTATRARQLRASQTEVERLLWLRLRDRRLNGAKFRRQVPFGPYIVDFVCMEAKLVIELDGGQHGEQSTYDGARTDFLKSQGYRVLRFWNNELLENEQGVLTTILNELTESNPNAQAH
jgi:very-short-patch-repair endonuclease